MISPEVLEALKNKYSAVHPLIFVRSKERAKTAGELFDILDTIPKKFPIVWNEENKRWTATDDLFQSRTFSFKEEE